MPTTSEVSFLISLTYMPVPHREEHLSALQSLEKSAKAQLITAPLFPYTGGVFFLMSEDTNPRKAIEDFVSRDPYVKN